MLITILGYWDEAKKIEWRLRGSKPEFDRACEELGKELAKWKQSIIVGNDSFNAADYHIVKGFVENVGEDTPNHLIHVIKLAGESFFQDLWNVWPRLFTTYGDGHYLREEAKLIAVQAAAAVLTIGGTETTYHIGLAAILAKKTLIPIASFGGASQRLLDHLEAYGQHKNQHGFGPLNGPWNHYLMQTALELSGITTPPKLFIIHGHCDDYFLLKDWLLKEKTLGSVMIMKEWTQTGRTMTEKFEELAGDADAAIALVTPDDEGREIADKDITYKRRARQNVWLEVGWLWGRLGRDKIMILKKGDIEVPSDLLGVETFQYDDRPHEREKEIRSFIKKIRCGAEQDVC